ncbi:hypothetical protein CF326_g2112 [Tilletia indica]|nr:hypothetical protein CF326_g2112 [Tilletia indica]
MVADEVAFFEGAARLPLQDIEDPARFTPIVHRKMYEKFGTFWPSYLASRERRLHPKLAWHFPPQVSHPPVVSPNNLPTETVDETGTCWPEPVPESHKEDCMEEFAIHTSLAPDATCAVCGRRSFNHDILFSVRHIFCKRTPTKSLDLEVLAVIDPHLLARPETHFMYGDPMLDGLALHRDGIHVSDAGSELDICNDCLSCLTRRPPRLPPLALANDNVRGFLPDDLQDITWLEERLCAKYLASAYIVRLYDLTAPGAEAERPRVMKGHACSFPLNTVSTATKLPWAVDKEAPLISCIVIGPRKPRAKDLRNVFKVRKEKVRALLRYLREHCKGYPQFAIDDHALNALPEDDVPELLMRHITYEEHNEVPSLFDKETTGLDIHPAFVDDVEDEEHEPRTFLEHHGMLDINGVSIPAHERTAAALASATGSERPDLVIRHGSSFVEDYNNPDLFPGMFPTLFPWGTGGFESVRRAGLSFDRQAKYLLDIAEPAFRRHWSFIFIVANIKQRRAIHHGSRFMCRARDFDRISTTIRNLTPAIVKGISDHLSRGGSGSTLSPQEAGIWSVLKKCQLISASVPGSRAIMIRARADIRGYIGQYGIFQLFLTLNPGPTHSPVFNIFFGDRQIRLDTRTPPMPNAKTRGTRVADDPVASSDYFHFHIAAVFQFLLGWDWRKKRSSPKGGLFGKLSAFYLVKEHSMRGQLHCHCLIWLEGGLNPSALRAKMRSDEEFQQRYFMFFDDLVRHGYPDAANGAQDPPASSERKPRQERPPRPSDSTYKEDFREDHHLLAHEVQLHKHTFTCFKGGRDSCRFLFPHEVTQASSFDMDTSSIHLRVQHPLINWHNPSLLVATRHNHDLKVVQSGKSGSAAATYITTYTTKSEETPENQISMINTVYERMAGLGASTSDPQALLTRCVMQFGRERQVHAQQAATYVRDLGDTEQSHKTIALLSGSLLARVLRLFGPTRDLDAPTDDMELPASSSLPSVEQDDSDDSHTSSMAEVPAESETPTHQPKEVITPMAAEPTESETPTNASAVPQPGSIDEDDDDGFDSDGLMPLNAKGLAHQVDDYLHRGATLAALPFYEFVQYVELDKPPPKRNNSHHDLADTHPNFKTHIHRYTPNKARGIPRCLVSRFPRSDGTPGHGDDYCAAMMAHFVPFTTTLLLKDINTSWEEAFATTTFSPAANRIMRNWAALNECEDARDADQLQRRRREANHSSRVDKQVAGMTTDGHDDSLADVNMEALLHSRPVLSAETLKYAATLDSSGWFHVGHGTPHASLGTSSSGPNFSWQTRRTWKKEQDILEAKAKADLVVPTATHGILAEQLTFDSTAIQPSTLVDPALAPALPAPATEHLRWRDRPPDDLLRALAKERNLTPSQALAFNIAGRRFFETLHGLPTEPLRLLMHGEAGTGKTVVVRLLRELMDRYGRGNEIKFMAPTGKAASAIGGMTQHSAFGIDVHRRGLTTEEQQNAQRENQAKRMRFLQKSFGHVQWLFFDEVSMTSCEVLHDIDQALRIATQRLDDPFGGVNVLFAGDLCQLPPVGAAPLYTRTSRASLSAGTRTKVELGRLAWLHIREVVEFTEQMRMKDSDMAAALSRLRVRACTDEDPGLFNTNLLYQPSAMRQITVKERHGLIVLAGTNQTVRTLNARRATSQAASHTQDLVVSHAIDSTNVPLNADAREALLNYNGRGESRVGMGRLPLFLGMPIIYRGPNQSLALGITNGAFGKVVGWDIVRDKLGFTIPKAAIVRFDDNATWQLSGLEPGCLPIYPTSSSFSFSLAENPDIVHKITRQQLPLQPGFAMTVHSAQGITCSDGVVVDLCRGGFPAYVAASRATRREDIYLISEVSRKQLNSPGLPATLRAELNRLQTLAHSTKLLHDHDNWRLGTSPQTSVSDPTNRPAKRQRASADEDDPFENLAGQEDASSSSTLNLGNISLDLRASIFDWLAQVHTQLALPPDVIWLARDIFNRYIAAEPASDPNAFLTGLTCLWIAAKYEDLEKLRLKKIARFISTKRSTRTQMIVEERNILATLRFRLSVHLTPTFWLEYFATAHRYGFRTRRLARVIVDGTFTEPQFGQLPSKTRAAAATLLAVKIVGRAWEPSDEARSGFREHALLPTARHMLMYLRSDDYMDTWMYKKYARAALDYLSPFVRAWALDNTI